MEFDSFAFILSTVVFFIYGASCIISTIFTFSLDTYYQIDEIVKVNVIPPRILTPLEVSIDVFDNWLIEHNRTAGPAMVLLCLADMKMFFDVIGRL